MYESFYGLTGKPFQLNPDPSFYFGSRGHKRAFAYLEYGLYQSEGFIIITGEIGAGKTTIVRSLQEQLDPAKVVAAQIVSTQLDADGRHRNPHLTDYKLVTASDAPRIDIAWIETDTPNAGPKGSKGVGEPPCVPTAGAVANAIAKVIGARVHRLPMTPERVWEARS